MADGIGIPGVSDKYKTNDLVESLMEVERIPLKREQTQLETYQKQQDAWRNVNQKMSTLRDSVKTLYSFENPFNNKLTTSSDENALTVDAGREAEYGSFKIDVVKPATADRFLSGSIDKDLEVPQGQYTFRTGDKSLDFNWKGGKVTDFVAAVNRRGGTTVKASLIGVSADKKSLLIESLKTGNENSLKFENDALKFVKTIDMISEVKPETFSFADSLSKIKDTQTKDAVFQKGMPEISKDNITLQEEAFTVPQRSGFETEIPSQAKNNKDFAISFSYKSDPAQDITDEINQRSSLPSMPEAGKILYGGISVSNSLSDPAMKKDPDWKPLEPISSSHYFFIKDSSGRETEIQPASFKQNEETSMTDVTVNLSDYPDAESLIVRNSSTNSVITVSSFKAFDATKNKGFAPSHAITEAGDAVIKYEGITMTRSSNDIDDVIPHITLHLHDTSEKTVTVKIDPDTESAKDALINFVGNYNQTIAEMNILSSDKSEIISELDYLTSDEQDKAKERLGMFQGDFTLTNGKSSLQRIISSGYRYSTDAQITLLSQIGISTNASTGNRGYNPGQMRGYLEVDEKKLDEMLASNLNEIKNMFGFDSDGDLIIDNGVAFLLDKQLTSWVQSGGIISAKTNALEGNIKSSNSKITRLETQLERKEAELKSKYASMEGTLNNLEAQQNSLNNYSNANNRK
ncbi:flagellar hook protein [Treponema rectale]|uniref:Flagellar hook-associated protein 2 n=1 Tax=Treponema rectale TaxID=744512 RepID=A0A840SCP7_9SPIR|nr:flagellar filament capping protein FliD [Treponema rectale]MBB5218500.1 flagellar hook-associated protein 2 [Treponema rectale]QOS39814.1 flagellar hook protein [Treponema rectale]